WAGSSGLRPSSFRRRSWSGSRSARPSNRRGGRLRPPAGLWILIGDFSMDVIAESQDGGVSNLAIGEFVGDGTITHVTTGFLPRYIKLVNLTERITFEWYRGMAATHTLKTVAAGT